MAAVMTLLLAVASPTVVSQPSPEALSSQQIFDQASTAAAKDDCKTATSLFEALEGRQVLKVGSVPFGAVELRKGRCLVQLNRVADGQRAIEQGLSILEKAGPDFTGDVADGVEALGDVATRYHDYDKAVGQYQRALALRTGMDRLKTLAKLASATAFDGDRAPLAYADEGIALISALPPKEQDKDSLAALHTFHARALLNQGKVQEGYAELKQALKLSGGLTPRATLGQASMRADLGMAAALAGHKSEARLYLAYTGAGRIKGSRFAGGVSMDPPLCGEETGLRPDDVAVVEFSIAYDGSVADAQTVYSRGNRAVASAFASAVNDWYWSPDEVKNLPVFYRLATRVELRCSTVGAGVPSIPSPALARFENWASSLLPELGATDSTPKKIERLRLALSRNEFSVGTMRRAAALGVIATLEAAPVETRIADANRAIVAATEAKAPSAVINWLRIVSVSGGHWWPDRRTSMALRALAAEPSVANDALSAATALMLAATKSRGNPQPEAPAMLQQVADDARLPDHHPLRQAARISLANLAAAAGDGAAAQRYFASTGLSEQQCALIGVQPRLRSSGANSDDYPLEAMNMGFEGWVNLEFDITADGRTATIRPIVAYPPLIFVDAASGMAKDFRYEASYRPGGGAACAANHATINFVMPN